MMGNVVRLERPEPPKKRGKAAKVPKTSAEIIIFPGVRYERWDDVAATTRRQSIGNARDYIEL